MESISVTGVLQEAGQRILTQGPAPDPGCKSNISSFLTFPLLLQWFICTRNSMLIVVIINDGGWDRWWSGWLISGVIGGTGDEYYLIVCFFYLRFSLVLSCHVFFWLSDWNMTAVVSVSLFIICFFVLSLVSLTRSYWCIEIVVSVM